jgi:DNA polymerase-3 subunit gamma/tau
MISSSSLKKEPEDHLVNEIIIKKDENKEEPENFLQVIELARARKDVRLQYELENNISLVSFEKEKIEINILNGSDSIASDLSKKLTEWTEKKWVVLVTSTEGQKTINQEKEDSDSLIRNKIEEHPIFLATVSEFKDASIKSIEEIPKLSIVDNDNPKEE